MSPDAARVILEQVGTDHTRSRKLMTGLEILEQACDIDKEASCRRDLLFVGNFDAVCAFLSEQDIRRLAQLGWYEDEDSFAHSV